MIRNILLCGVGGQGILLGAKIIACAAEHAGFQVATKANFESKWKDLYDQGVVGLVEGGGYQTI